MTKNILIIILFLVLLALGGLLFLKKDIQPLGMIYGDNIGNATSTRCWVRGNATETCVAYDTNRKYLALTNYDYNEEVFVILNKNSSTTKNVGYMLATDTNPFVLQGDNLFIGNIYVRSDNASATIGVLKNWTE